MYFCTKQTIMQEKKDCIADLGIKDFKTYSGHMDYVDDDFAIASNLSRMTGTDRTFRLRCLVIIMCIEGRFRIELNSAECHVECGHWVAITPGTVISRLEFSPQSKINMVCFSNDIMNHCGQKGLISLETALYLRNNPINRIGAYRGNPAITQFGNLIRLKINDRQQPFTREIIRNLTMSFYLELVSTIYTNMPRQTSAVSAEAGIRGPQMLFFNFIDMLHADNGINRSVAHFAKLLCCSPKYLSRVVKDSTGRSPLEIINEYAIGHIKRRLRQNDKNIKELAYEFKFPNQSFFCKYVRSHIGLSPGAYRRQQESAFL